MILTYFYLSNILIQDFYMLQRIFIVLVLLLKDLNTFPSTASGQCNLVRLSSPKNAPITTHLYIYSGAATLLAVVIMTRAKQTSDF